MVRRQLLQFFTMACKSLLVNPLNCNTGVRTLVELEENFCGKLDEKIQKTTKNRNGTWRKYRIKSRNSGNKKLNYRKTVTMVENFQEIYFP